MPRRKVRGSRVEQKERRVLVEGLLREGASHQEVIRKVKQVTGYKMSPAAVSGVKAGLVVLPDMTPPTVVRTVSQKRTPVDPANSYAPLRELLVEVRVEMETLGIDELRVSKNGEVRYIALRETSFTL